MPDPPLDLPPELRRAVAALERQEPWRHSKLLLLFGLWATAGTLAVRGETLWVQVPAWLVIGGCLHAIGVFMHDAAHHNLLRRPTIDRTIGFCCGLPVLFSCSCYRATHAQHHRHENTDLDPDNLSAEVPVAWQRRWVIGGFLLIGVPLYSLSTMLFAPLRAGSPAQAAVCVTEVALIGVIYGTLFTAASADAELQRWVTHAWLGGLAFALPIANFRALAEHSVLDGDDPRDPRLRTRSLPAGRLVRFVQNGQNYHLEHHLFPRVPWYNLGNLHRLLGPEYRAHGVVVTTYPRFARELLAYLLARPGAAGR